MAKDQATDDGTAKRGVLLAAFAGSEGHRDHADNHGKSGHDNGAEAGGARLQRGDDGVAVVL